MEETTSNDQSRPEPGEQSPDQRERPIRTAQDRLNFIAEASEILASSLDYETTLASLARLCVPRLGDWCAVDMLAPDGAIERLAVAHVDPEKVKWAHELHRKFPPDPTAPHGVPNVIRTGREEFYPYIPQELLDGAAQTDEMRDLIREIGFTSVIVVPLLARGRSLGAITLVTTESAWHYNDEDLKLALDLARRAAMAVDNALLYRAAHEQEERLRVTLTSIGDAVISTDIHGHITFMNPIAVDLTGWNFDDARGLLLHEVFVIANESTGKPVESPVERVLREGVIVGLANHTVLLRRDGTSIPIDDSAAPIRDTHGDLIGVVMVFHDVTERRRSEAALRESEARFRSMADSAPVLIWVAGPDGLCTYFNRPWLEFTGRSIEQELGMGWQENVHPDDLKRCLDTCHSAFALRQQFRMEYRLRHHSGEYRWVLDSGIPRFSHDGQLEGYIGSCFDITDRMAAEEALRRSENQLRLVIDSVPMLISYIDADEHFLFNSRSYREWCGAEGKELTGRRIRDVSGESLYLQVRDRVRAALAGETVTFELTVPLEENRPDRHVRVTYIPDIAEDGVVRGFVAVVHDITPQKRSERELQEAKEAAESANRAKDQFLAVLSHELRTPLTPVLSMVDALEGDPGISAELQPYIEMIRRNVELEARLIDDLLDINRIVRGKLELSMSRIDMHELLRDVIDAYHGDFLRKNIEIRFEPAARRCHVLADDTRLRQVFGNLLQNAVKFTPENGLVVVQTGNHDGNMLEVSVTDSGIGIEAELLPRIFNAFEQGEGTITRRFGGLGLGLAVSRSLVEMHGGTLTARSEGKERGAVFTVDLGLAPETAAREPGRKSRPEQPLPRKQTCVLLVDDHEDTSRMLALLLERHGYTVFTAGSVRGALDVAADRGFDVLISDIGLPDGSGLDLMSILRERGGAVKGIALSGFGMEDDIRRSRAAGFREHLTKPVSFQKLREAIDRLLD